MDYAIHENGTYRHTYLQQGHPSCSRCVQYTVAVNYAHNLFHLYRALSTFTVRSDIWKRVYPQLDSTRVFNDACNQASGKMR